MGRWRIINNFPLIRDDELAPLSGVKAGKI
jgi:hypothetical protein